MTPPFQLGLGLGIVHEQTADGGAGGGWTPENIPTVGWYDASDDSTINLVGNQIQQWDDKSGNDRHLIQNNGGAQPEYDLAEINGLNAAHFIGTFDLIEVIGLPDIDLSEVTIISLGKVDPTGDSPTYGRVAKTDNTDQLENRATRNANGGRINSVCQVDGVSANLTGDYTDQLADSRVVINSVAYDGANHFARVNGGRQTYSNASAPDGATFTINEIKIGRESNTPRNHTGEMIIIPTANLATIQLVEGYLAHKWGIVEMLPSDHPYRFDGAIFAEDTLWTPESLAAVAVFGVVFHLTNDSFFPFNGCSQSSCFTLVIITSTCVLLVFSVFLEILACS